MKKTEMSMQEVECDSIKLHYTDSAIRAEKCRLRHKAFLFIEDKSDLYASAVENRVYYECACLECGKIADYQMSISDRKRTVFLKNIPSVLDEFYNVRKRYLELQQDNLDVEEIIEIINAEYENNLKLKKIK